MVLFPIIDEELSSTPVSAWNAIEEQLKQGAAEYWLITQPSHAALAGDLAVALREELFGQVGSSRVDLQACKLEYSIVSPK